MPEIFTRVMEPVGSSGVKTVIVSYYNGTGWFNKTMTRIAGNPYNGNYTGQLPRMSYNTLVRFYIRAEDNTGNFRIDDNASNFYQFRVIDFLAPVINQTGVVNAPIYFDEKANITCRVVEPRMAAGVYQVRLYFQNATGWFSLPMTLYQGDMYDGRYTALIPPHPFGTVIHFYVAANDTARNLAVDDNSGNLYSYLVLDYLPPAPVNNLVATAYLGARTINLTWTPNSEPDFLLYQIHRSLSETGFIPSKANHIANVTNRLTSFFVNTGLAENVTYFYIVLAVDSSLLISTYTRIVNGTTRNTVNPSEIVKIYANVNTHLVFGYCDTILDLRAQNTFELTVNNISTSKDFSGHVLLMNFYINISIIGSPGSLTGSITLILDEKLLANLSADIEANSFTIYYWDDFLNSWEALPSVYHAGNHSVTAILTHLSVFGAFATLIGGGFPMWVLFILIGGVAAVAIVVLARRKKVIPTDRIIQTINSKGQVKIEELAKEYKMDSSAIMEVIQSGIEGKQLRGFLANKRKEFITVAKLKAELTKRLEGD
jgi:hypothetical protein